MSKIIRAVKEAPTVYVGERHLDFKRQRTAEHRLGELFEKVAVITDDDGAKYIPIEEVAKLEQGLQQAHDSSYQSGYKAGFETGLKQGTAKAEEVLKQFETAIADAVTQRQVVFEEARQKILELVLQISRKVTIDAVQVDPETTAAMISGVIATLLDPSRLKIRVHPDHLPIVEQSIDTYLKGAATIKDIAIVPDPRVQYGGCFIETPTGDIDARLESQFEVIEETLAAEEAQG